MIYRWILTRGLDALLKALGRLTDAQLKKTAESLNKKVDIPGLSEATEGKMIFGTLKNCVEAAKELLALVK